MLISALATTTEDRGQGAHATIGGHHGPHSVLGHHLSLQLSPLLHQLLDARRLLLYLCGLCCGSTLHRRELSFKLACCCC